MNYEEILKRIPFYFWIISVLMIVSFSFWKKKRGTEWKFELEKERGEEEEAKMKLEVILEKISFGLFLGFLILFLFSGVKILNQIIKKEGPFLQPELLDENLYPLPPTEKLNFPLPPKTEESIQTEQE